MATVKAKKRPKANKKQGREEARLIAIGELPEKRQKNTHVKKVNWDRYEALLEKGIQHPQASEMLGMRPNTLTQRCVRDFGMPLKEKFAHLFGDKTNRLVIDWNRAAQYYRIGATHEEVASMLKISYPTMRERCEKDNGKTLTAFRDEQHSEIKLALRQKQIKVALGQEEVLDPETHKVLKREIEPNVTMLMHLGKHMLQQREVTEQNITVQGVKEETKNKLKELFAVGSVVK